MTDKKKMQLACPACGFASEDTQAFLDHCLTTQHVKLPAGAEDGSIEDTLQMLGALQRAVGNPDSLPDNASIRPVSVDDILADDDMDDAQKVQLLAQLVRVFERQAPTEEDDDAPPSQARTETQDVLKNAVLRANAIQSLLVAGEIKPDRETLVALTIVTGTAAQQYGLSMNDAFSLFLAVYERAEESDETFLGQVKRQLTNALGHVVKRTVVDTPPKTTTH